MSNRDWNTTKWLRWMWIPVAAGIFVLDVSLPRRVAAGIPYVILVLLCMWSPRRMDTHIAAATGSVLTVLGFLLSAPTGVVWILPFKRGVALAVIWITAALLLQRRRSNEALLRTHTELETRVKDRTKELAEVNQKLTDENTQRKRAELDLRARETLLKAIRDSTFDPMITIDFQGIVRSASASVERVFGWTQQQLVGRNVSELMAEPYRSEHDSFLAAYLRTGETTILGQPPRETEAMRKDGSVFPCELSISRVDSPEHEHPMFTGYIRDITERKQVEAALQQSEERSRQQLAELELVYQTAPVGMGLMDTELRFLRINDELAQMNGPSALEHIGRRITEVVPDIARSVAPIVRNVIATGEPVLNMEVHETNPSASNQQSTWLASYYPVKSDAGVIRAVGVVVQDITKRKQAEQTLQENERRLRTVVEDMPVMLCAFDTEGNVVAWNRECEEVTGYTRYEIVGNPRAMEWLLPDAAYRNSVFVATRSRPSGYRNLELRVTCKDGSTKFVLWSDLSSRFPIDGWGAWNVGIDVTTRKAVEKVLRQRDAELAHVSRVSSMGEMTAAITHDIKQPLFAIDNYAKTCSILLDSNREDRGTEMQRCTKQIAEQARRAATIIERLNDFMKKTVPHRSPVDVGEVMRESIALTAAFAREQQIAVTCDSTQRLPNVLFDRVQLQQVIVNLLVNACQALSDSDSRPRAVKVGLHVMDGNLEVAIEDNGPGLPNGEANKLFDPFYTTKRDGLGIGLTICRTIITNYEGKIWATSTPGSGATFRFTLPLADGAKKDGH